MMKVGVISFLLLSLQISSVVGDETDYRDEISDLLTFIENSNCTFIRNGESYPSAKAREHIDKKYDYLKKRISSAEQFITYTASKSSISGEQYLVICDGATISSEQWLKTELNRLRENNRVP